MSFMIYLAAGFASGLLGGMGYPHTEGFLWYVSRGEIERVV